jgi:hypothetical protein
MFGVMQLKLITDLILSSDKIVLSICSGAEMIMTGTLKNRPNIFFHFQQIFHNKTYFTKMVEEKVFWKVVYKKMVWHNAYSLVN